MQHTISMLDLRSSPGQVFDRVQSGGDTYIVKRNKTIVGVITSPEHEEEYQQLIQEKVTILETKIRSNLVLSEAEYSFLVKHARYPESRRILYCNQQRIDTLSHFGGAAELEPDDLDLDLLDQEIAEREKSENLAI